MWIQTLIQTLILMKMTFFDENLQEPVELLDNVDINSLKCLAIQLNQ